MKFILTLLFSSFLLSAVHAQSGQWVWGRGSSGSGAEGYVAATDDSGNVYGAGYNFGWAPISFGSITIPYIDTFGPGSDVHPIWVKYSSGGTVLWADGTQNGDAWLYNITTDSNGDLIVFGSFDSPIITIGSTTLTNTHIASGGNQYFIAKYNPVGTLLWAISDGSAAYFGNTLFDYVFILSTGGITTDASDNIYITSSFLGKTVTIGSYTLNNADTSGQTEDIFIAKYSPSGTLVWATSAGGTSDDFSYGITVVPSGKIYITGLFWSPSIAFGASIINNPYGIGGYTGTIIGTEVRGIETPLAYIAEFSPAGTPLWAQEAGGSNGAFGIGLVSDQSGNVYMTGGFCDTSISFGATIIHRTYPATVPYMALYLVQYSPANVVTWSKTIGSASSPLWGFSIGLAACGEIWVAGNLRGDANIDGHVLYSPLDTMAYADPVFIAGYNLAGGVIGYSALRSGGDDQSSIACDPKGNVFICSDYKAGGNFYVGPDTLSVGGDENFYIGKYAYVAGNTDTTSEQQDVFLCSDTSSIVLSAPAGYASYYWDNATTSSLLNVTQPGTYIVLCTSTCSLPVLADTINVQALSSPEPFFLGRDTTLCAGEAYTITSGNSSTVWNTNDTGASITVTKTGSYIATISNNCGSVSDSVMVGFNRDCIIWIPNAFTPNDDGLNDIFRLGGELALIQNFSFSIYNRWGQRIFYTEDVYSGWNGKLNGILQDIGTYFYMIHYDLNGERHIMKGDFELIR